ncbi:MAG: hypothetical protein ABWY51_05335, partial [Gaiellaceae bacterium]
QAELQWWGGCHPGVTGSSRRGPILSPTHTFGNQGGHMDIHPYTKYGTTRSLMAVFNRRTKEGHRA